MTRKIHNKSIKIDAPIEIQREKEIGSDEEMNRDTVVTVVNGIQTIVSIKGVGSAKKRGASL